MTELLADSDGPIADGDSAHDQPGHKRRGVVGTFAAAGAMAAALGVVYGDIGTSPLYALQTVFSIDHGAVRATPGDVYGVISLVFWSITVVVSLKYVTFILRADNDGEGGVMALAALLRRTLGNASARRGAIVMAVGIFGASLFYGDSMITPAISVLSAVEGLKVPAPGLSHLVIPIAAVILAVLFGAQRWGTARVGSLFGPVMLLWFTTLAVLGLREVVPHPGILRGLSPSYALAFITDRPYPAFIGLGAVVLAITGAEALYADLGQFGPRPIRRAWFAVVFPALTLNYLAQAVLHLWRALAKRDWEAVKTVLSDDCIFVDMPLGPTLAARGPDNVVKRLKVALENENLASYANHDGVLLTNGVDVIYEHLEIFTSRNGETANNPIVSVHKVSDGRASLWKDYWDLNAIANTAWYQRAAEAGDFSWVFDATGLN